MISGSLVKIEITRCGINVQIRIVIIPQIRPSFNAIPVSLRIGCILPCPQYWAPITTNVLMAALRCVETVKISFYISIVSLIVNVGINYVLIFGRFGAPELGIRGAAIGTLVARIVELGIVVVYMLKIDKKLKLFSENFMKFDAALRKDYAKVEIPVMLSQV